MAWLQNPTYEYELKTPSTSHSRLLIRQDLQQRAGLGSTIWDSAFLLSAYFEMQLASDPNCFVDRRVLELGAGAGLVGLLLAAHGARVELTDLPSAVPLLTQNASANFGQGSCVSVRPLNWCCAEHEAALKGSYDVLVASDVAYTASNPELFQRFADLCCRLCRRATPASKLIIAQEPRTVEMWQTFKQALQDAGFALQEVDCKAPGAEAKRRHPGLMKSHILIAQIGWLDQMD